MTEIKVTPDPSCPVKVYGLPPFFDGEGFRKCHIHICETVANYAGAGHTSCGGRLLFRTDSKSFTVRLTTDMSRYDSGSSVYGSASADVYYGTRPNAFQYGPVSPGRYSDGPVTFEQRYLRDSEEPDDITVFLPHNAEVLDASVLIEDDAALYEPTPYRNSRPVVFYGSSITEGAHASRAGCAYYSMVSNRLNLDIVNYGFPGNCRGELPFADYIAELNPSAVIMDYDANAPDADFLEKTHEPFFLRLRERLPSVPVVMVSSPDYEAKTTAVCAGRKAVIKKTYENALARGDGYVRFIDGRKQFPDRYRPFCATDSCHPNTLGYAFMADAVEEALSDFMADICDR